MKICDFFSLLLSSGGVDIAYDVSGSRHSDSGTGTTDRRGRLDIADLFEGDTVKITATKDGMVDIRDLVKTVGNKKAQNEMISLSEKLQVPYPYPDQILFCVPVVIESCKESKPTG